jgi:phage tail-like protein
MVAVNQYQLRIQGPDELRIYTLPRGKTIIGYSPESDIFLNDRTVSGKHAQVDDSSGAFMLTDLGSTNGTTLQNERLIANVPFRLNLGETFRIGRYALTFSEPPPSDDVRSMEQDEDAGQQRQRFRPYTAEVPPGLSRYSLALLAQLPALYQMAAEIPAAWDTALALPDATPATFLARFLALFEATLLPITWLIENFDFYLDPQTAPVDFFPWLESWYGLPLVDGLNQEQRRLLLRHAHELYDLKGSPTALSKVIELCTGCTPIIEEPATGPGFRVTLPATTSRPVDRNLVEQLIIAFKPVHIPYELK